MVRERDEIIKKIKEDFLKEVKKRRNWAFIKRRFVVTNEYEQETFIFGVFRNVPKAYDIIETYAKKYFGDNLIKIEIGKYNGWKVIYVTVRFSLKNESLQEMRKK